MKARSLFISLLYTIILSFAATSCGEGEGHDDRRSDRLAAALAAADDSMSVYSPHVSAMLDAGISHATDSLEYYDWYLRKMRYSVQQGVPDTASLRWGQAYSFLSRQERTPRVDGMMGLLLNTKGSYYKLHRDPQLSVHAYREAYGRLTGSDAEERLPDVCANLGDAYISANDLPRAAHWYRRALVLADSLQLPAKDKVTLYMGLGRIYLKLGDYDSSLECYKTADRNFDTMPLNMQFYFLTNYGNYYYYTGKYEASATVFKRMKKLVEKHNMQDSYERYLCDVNMADLYLNLGRTAEARRLLDSAEKYFTGINDETAIYYCHTIRIGLALKAGDTAEVERILGNEHITTAIDYSLVDIRQRYLRDYYLKRGDYKGAYMNLSENISRNVKHNAANMRASEIMMRYGQDTLRLRYHMNMQAKDAHIRAARLWLYVGVLLIAALALLLLYVYTFARKRRLQLNMQLMQLRLLNVRSRISPHFIFNVLNNRMAKTSPEDFGELMALVKLIRANLKMSGKNYVSLKEELDFVRYYVSVESHSAGSDFSFTVDAPPDSVLENIAVPSMFIQILVENSIKHGLKGRSGSKRLRVSVTADGDSCRITVADNGTGFDIRRSDPSSTKTGLKVIRNTINIINQGRKRKMRLDVRNVTAPDGTVAGCEVTLTVPPGLRPVCAG